MKDSGGSAFPVIPPQDTAAGAATGYPYPEQGMTLRDYFAAKALVIIPVQGAYNTQENEGWARYTARQAYHLADAMLKERSKT